MSLAGDEAIGQKLHDARAALGEIFGPFSGETIGSTEFEWRLHETPRLGIERIGMDTLPLVIRDVTGETEFKALENFLVALHGAPVHATPAPLPTGEYAMNIQLRVLHKFDIS